MNDKKLITSRIMPTVSVLGILLLLVLQYVWFINSYRMIEQNMMEKCKICLRGAVDEELFIRVDRSFVSFNKNVERGEDNNLILPKGSRLVKETTISQAEDLNLVLQEYADFVGIKLSLDKIDSLFKIKMKGTYEYIPSYNLSLENDTILTISYKKNIIKTNDKKKDTVELNHQVENQNNSVSIHCYDSINNKTVTVRISPNQVVKLEITHSFGNVLRKAQYLFISSLVFVVFIAIIILFQLKNVLRENRFVRFLKEYTSALTHDLRSPLNSVNMAATVLYDKTLPLGEEEKREYYRICKDQSRSLLNSIDKILTVAKSEQTKLMVRPVLLGAKQYLKGLTEAFINNNVHSKGLTIDVLCEPEDIMVRLDPTLMDHVFNNLMDNAVKYSYNEVSITFQAFKQDNQVHISIKDNGMGIPANDLDTIFLNFKRGNVIERKRMFGYGIGLSYSKEVVNAHGGDITVISKEMEGSLFTIILPN